MKKQMNKRIYLKERWFTEDKALTSVTPAIISRVYLKKENHPFFSQLSKLRSQFL
jgi:hypothetical protein